MRVDLVPVDDLVTIDEIADRLHWNVGLVLNIVTHKDERYKLKFPKPLVGPAKRGVWLWTDVEAWFEDPATQETQERKRQARAQSMTQRRSSWRSGRKSA